MVSISKGTIWHEPEEAQQYWDGRFMIIVEADDHEHALKVPAGHSIDLVVFGNAHGDATLTGPGVGSAFRLTLDGCSGHRWYGGAFRHGDGPGNAERYGPGLGNSHRGGAGDGHAVRWGGPGGASNSSAGFGDAVCCGQCSRCGLGRGATRTPSAADLFLDELLVFVEEYRRYRKT